EPHGERLHTYRDGKLMEAYLQKALGYTGENIHHLADVQQPNQIHRQIGEISAAVNDSTELFVYIGGYGDVRNGKELYLKNVAPSGEESPKDISLRSIFNRIASLSSAKTWVVLDVDFSRSLPEDFSNAEREALVRSHSAILTQNPDCVLMMS